jgi:hypothetical protein
MRRFFILLFAMVALYSHADVGAIILTPKGPVILTGDSGENKVQKLKIQTIMNHKSFVLCEMYHY